MIDEKFKNTKGYLSAKDTYMVAFFSWPLLDSVLTYVYSNEIPIPDIPNEPYLLLYLYTTFLSLAFLSNAFIVIDLTPITLYSLKVLLGSR